MRSISKGSFAGCFFFTFIIGVSLGEPHTSKLNGRFSLYTHICRMSSRLYSNATASRIWTVSNIFALQAIIEVLMQPAQTVQVKNSSWIVSIRAGSYVDKPGYLQNA